MSSLPLRHHVTPSAPATVDRDLVRQLAEFRGENNRLLGAEPSGITQSPPFAQLAARYGRPLKIAILSDFTRIPYANGAAFQTRFLYQELQRCGHQVTVIGPEDPDTKPGDLPPNTVALPSLPVRMYPGVHVPVPFAPWVFDAERWDFDLIFAQTTTLLLEFGVWLRKMRGIPLLCVNTTHLAAAYDVLLPEALAGSELVHAGIELALRRPYQKLFARIYNESDGLVVLSEGLRSYWRQCGVNVPIHVVPRAVQPEVFDKALNQPHDDPYEAVLGERAHGPRLLSAGRHTREKCQDRTIRLFARHVLPAVPNATLTVVGQGPDTDYFRKVAADEGVTEQVVFVGEVPFEQMPRFYAHADVFLHTSLSETYGNVLGEALWCGTPTVAFADGMGASAQVRDGHNGVLLSPGKSKSKADEEAADQAFAGAVLALLNDAGERMRVGRNAAQQARERCSPPAVQARLADAFMAAEEHAKRSGLRATTEQPRLLRWLTTARHFQNWSLSSVGLSLVGSLRKPHNKNSTAQPQIHQQPTR